MPSSDYTNVVGGGLKLKGGGIVKKNKKKPKQHPSPEAEDPTSATNKVKETPEPSPIGTQNPVAENEQLQGAESVSTKQDGKTEAQRRYEERRRKRLEERLQREGIKTHKERVEELNKYLSNLSEHHDMPRIGPG